MQVTEDPIESLTSTLPKEVLQYMEETDIEDLDVKTLEQVGELAKAGLWVLEALIDGEDIPIDLIRTRWQRQFFNDNGTMDPDLLKAVAWSNAV